MSLKKLRKKKKWTNRNISGFCSSEFFSTEHNIFVTLSSAIINFEWMYTSSVTGTPWKNDFQKQNFQNIFEDNIEIYYDYYHLKSVMGAQTVETNEVFPITNALCVKTKENNNEYHFVLRNSKSFCRERRNNDWLLLIKETLMLFSRSLTHLLFKTLYKGMASSWDGLVLVMHDCPHSWLSLRWIEMDWDGLRWIGMDWYR